MCAARGEICFALDSTCVREPGGKGFSPLVGVASLSYCGVGDHSNLDRLGKEEVLDRDRAEGIPV